MIKEQNGFWPNNNNGILTLLMNLFTENEPDADNRFDIKIRFSNKLYP